MENVKSQAPSGSLGCYTYAYLDKHQAISGKALHICATPRDEPLRQSNGEQEPSSSANTVSLILAAGKQGPQQLACAWNSFAEDRETLPVYNQLQASLAYVQCLVDLGLDDNAVHAMQNVVLTSARLQTATEASCHADCSEASEKRQIKVNPIPMSRQQRGAQLDVRQCLQTCMNSGRFELAAKLGAEVLQVDMLLSSESLSLVLEAARRHGSNADALKRMLNAVTRRGHLLDSRTYIPLVRAHENMPHKAVTVLDDLRQAGIRPHIHVYNSFFRILLHDWSSSVAHSQLLAMLGEGTKPDYITLTHLLKGIEKHWQKKLASHSTDSSRCSSSRVEDGHSQQLCSEVENLSRSTGILYKSSAAGPYLQVLSRYRQWGRMSNFLHNYTKLGGPKDRQALDIGISMLCRAGRIQQALDLAERMAKAGWAWSEATYASLLTGFAIKSKTEDARKLWDEYTRQGMRLTTALCNAMLKVEGLSGSMDGALALLELMHNSGCKADDKTWSELRYGAMISRRQDIIATIDSHEDKTVENFGPLLDYHLRTAGAGYCDDSDEDSLM